MPTKIVGSGIPDTKALTVDQFFDYLDRLTDEPTKVKIYATVAWVYRCIELISNNLSAIPYKILRGETELEDFPIDFDALLWSLGADLSIFGAGFWLKDRPRVTQELQRLNPQTMRVKKSPSEGIVGFVQEIDGAKDKAFKVEDIIYFRYYHPSDDLGPGVSPMQVALEAADLGRNANVWASQFFSHGAIPAVILHTEQNVPDAELERVSGAWNKLTQGARRAWRTLVLRRGLKPEVIGQPIKDLAMEELFGTIRSQIAVAFGVPQTMLSDAANYATAKEHRLSFYQDTVMPKARQIAWALNEQLFDELGLEFVFQFNEIEAIQDDESDKAEMVRMLVDGQIITKDEARDMLGFEPMKPDQEDELVPDVPPATMPEPERPQDTGPNVQPNIRALELAMEADLEKWQRKALAKGADAPFESEFIPLDVMEEIRLGLEDAKAEEEVRAVFRRGGMPIASNDTKAHNPRLTLIKCPVCGHGEADLYDDHGGLCVCRNEDCGITFDPVISA